MVNTAPDTNLFIFHLVKGGSDQEKKSQDYFETEELDFVLLPEVENQFHRRIDDFKAQHRNFVEASEEEGEWDSSEPDNNFTKFLKERGSPKRARADLSRLARRFRQDFSNFTDEMRRGSDADFEREFLENVKPLVAPDSSEFNDEKLIHNGLDTVFEFSENLIIASDDSDIKKNTDYPAVIEEYEDYFEVELSQMLNAKDPHQLSARGS